MKPVSDTRWESLITALPSLLHQLADMRDALMDIHADADAE